MTSQVQTKKRKVINSDSRQMVANVYRYLKEEYQFTVDYLEPNCDVSHLRNITQRTADATGVNLRTVERILKEEKVRQSTSAQYVPPVKKRKAVKNSDSNKDCVFIEIVEPIMEIEVPAIKLEKPES